ncbi:hypothetical protein N5P37_007271, partial [Trichoderma harzianum]
MTITDSLSVTKEDNPLVEDAEFQIQTTYPCGSQASKEKPRYMWLETSQRLTQSRALFIPKYTYKDIKRQGKKKSNCFSTRLSRLENTMRELMSSLDKTQLEKLWKLRELTSLDEDQIRELQRLHESTQTNDDTLIPHIFQQIVRLGRHAQRGINSPHRQPRGTDGNDAPASVPKSLSADNSISADYSFLYMTLIQQCLYQNTQGPLG